MQLYYIVVSYVDYNLIYITCLIGLKALSTSRKAIKKSLECII